MALLTMQHFLVTFAVHGFDAEAPDAPNARSVLLQQGYHHKVITAKAEKASRKGYYDYGVVADGGWITDKGRDFIDEHGELWRTT